MLDVSDFLRPHGLSSSAVQGDSPGKNTGVDCMPSSRVSSWHRDWTQLSLIAGGFFTVWATREALEQTLNKVEEKMENRLEENSKAIQKSVQEINFQVTKMLVRKQCREEIFMKY